MHQLLKLSCIIFFSFNFTICAMLSISVRGLSSIGKEQIIVIDWIIISSYIDPRFEIREDIHNSQSRLFFDISNITNHIYTGNFTNLTPDHQECLKFTAYVRVRLAFVINFPIIIMHHIEWPSVHSNTCSCYFYHFSTSIWTHNKGNEHK